VSKKSDGKKKFVCTSGPFKDGGIWLSPTNPVTAVLRIDKARGMYQGRLGAKDRREAVWCPR
jgi:hypothetical protein